MPARRVDVEFGKVLAGSSLTLQWPNRDDNDVPVDMTSPWVNTFTLRQKATDAGTPLLRKVTGTGITLATSAAAAALSIVNDVAEVTILGSDMYDGSAWASWIPNGQGTYWYGISRSDLGPVTWVYGQFIITANAAR